MRRLEYFCCWTAVRRIVDMGAKVILRLTAQITKMLGRVDQEFVDISAMALSAAISWPPSN
jgi:hypothetical protein